MDGVKVEVFRIRQRDWHVVDDVEAVDLTEFVYWIAKWRREGQIIRLTLGAMD